MVGKLPPALEKAQRQAAIDRGDAPVSVVDALDMDEALEEIAVGTAIASLAAQDKAQAPVEAPSPLSLDRPAQTALLRWLKENNLLREPKPMPLAAIKLTFTVHNTLHTWGLDAWNYFQDTVGVHMENSKLPRCYQNPNRNDIVFWWEDVKDCNEWIVWARAERAKGLNRYPNIQIFVEIEV
jgi:hypothetical protein